MAFGNIHRQIYEGVFEKWSSSYTGSLGIKEGNFLLKNAFFHFGLQFLHSFSFFSSFALVMFSMFVLNKLPSYLMFKRMFCSFFFRSKWQRRQKKLEKYPILRLYQKRLSASLQIILKLALQVGVS